MRFDRREGPRLKCSRRCDAMPGMWNERPQHSIYQNHPNPAWARRDWTSLDGAWNIRRGGRSATINVPFPVGSEASGVDFPDRGTFLYSRSFEVPRRIDGSRYFLNVGAADYEARVLVNGRDVGRHSGGYSTFRR